MDMAAFALQVELSIANKDHMACWDFLAVHWLRLCLSTARGMGLTPSLGTKIPHAVQFGKKKIIIIIITT